MVLLVVDKLWGRISLFSPPQNLTLFKNTNMSNVHEIKVVPKRESILRPDIHAKVHELLNQEYRIVRPNRISINEQQQQQYHETSVPRVRISSEGPPSSYIRDLTSRGGGRLLANSATQTDFSKNVADNRGAAPNTSSMSEVETLSFYKMTSRERLDQLRLMLTDDNYLYRYDRTSPYDPCLEYQLYFR